MARRTVVVHHPEGYIAIRNRVAQVGGAVASAVHRDARSSAPKKTGFLASTIHLVRASEFRWFVTVSAEHWIYQEYGTLGRNPVIRPIRKRALWWQGLPHPVSIVNKHPGNKPHPFMRPSIYKPRAFAFTPGGEVVVSG